jgi:hypothetical protein
MVDSFSYRFETPDRTIVISGDTAPTQTLIDQSKGCDILIHEAYSMMAYRNTERPTREFRHRHHTSSGQLIKIANEVKPELLVTYHRSSVGEESSNLTQDPDRGNPAGLQRSCRCRERSGYFLTPAVSNRLDTDRPGGQLLDDRPLPTIACNCCLYAAKCCS